jgi:translation initiation factor 1
MSLASRAMSRERDRLVYSSARGRVSPAAPEPPRRPRGDGVVRVRRETQGRGGKTVTTIAGVPLDDAALAALASELKRRCGTGGTAKDGVIEIQGDHRELLVAELEGRGYTVKRAGG